MTLGTRPEHCGLLAPESARATDEFGASVEIVEPLGAETFLHLHTGTHQLVSRIHSTLDRAEAGHRFRFRIDAERAHLFDSDSGNRIV